MQGTFAMADHGKGTDHVHGTMDTRVQEKTFAGFIRMVTWGACLSIGILIFLALTNA
jgi:Bacterial aa3 type cytochrome c oxidase subunit IV